MIMQSNIKKIGHVYEYPTMHDIGISRHGQSMIACMISTEYFWEFKSKDCMLGMLLKSLIGLLHSQDGKNQVLTGF